MRAATRAPSTDREKPRDVRLSANVRDPADMSVRVSTPKGWTRTVGTEAAMTTHCRTGNLERLGIDPPAEFVRARTLLTLGAETAMANPVDALLADFQSGALTERGFPDRLRAAALEIAAKDSARAVLRDLSPALVRHAIRAVRGGGDHQLPGVVTLTLGRSRRFMRRRARCRPRWGRALNRAGRTGTATRRSAGGGRPRPAARPRRGAAPAWRRSRRRWASAA